MAPRSINSWVKDLRGPLRSPYSGDDDDDRPMSAYVSEEDAERKLHAAKARALLEGKFLSFRDSGADVGDPWKAGDDDGEEVSIAEAGVRNLRSDVTPEPLKPKRSNTTKELHILTEPEWGQETQVWSMKMQPSESVEDLQKMSNTKARSVSSGRGSASGLLSGAWTLTPSNSPYQPTWLIDRESQKTSGPAGGESQSAAFSKSLGQTTNDLTAIKHTDSGVESRTTEAIRTPPSSYHPDSNGDTLQSSDSISCAGLPSPSTSSNQEPTRRGSAGIRVGDRILYAPQIPPTLHTSPRASTDPLTQYRNSGPSRDIEMQPILVPVDQSPDEYKPEEPQNGRMAWLHALAGFLVVFNCWGVANAFGLFQAYYEIYDLPSQSASNIAWIGSLQLCLVFGLGVPVGRLTDTGYFHSMFYSGSCIICLGLLSSSWCTSLATLLITQGLVTGLGMGMVFNSGLVALMTWFDDKHIGMAMGVCAAGSCIGGIVYVLVARTLLLSHGFGTTMRVLTGIAASTLFPANCIFRVRGQQHKNSSLGHPNSRASPPGTKTWRTFREPAYILLAFGMFFSFLGVYFGFVYIVTYSYQVLHMGNTAATNLLVYMLVANLPGRFVPALISDRCIGPLNTIIPSLFLSSIVVWIWAATTPEKAGLTIIACFYGFASAGLQVLYAPTMYSFCVERRSADDGGEEQVLTNKIGIRAGGISTCIGLACLAGTPIGGVLISARTVQGLERPYLYAQVFAGLCLLAGGSLLLGSRVAKAGWKATRV